MNAHTAGGILRPSVRTTRCGHPATETKFFQELHENLSFPLITRYTLVVWAKFLCVTSTGKWFSVAAGTVVHVSVVARFQSILNLSTQSTGARSVASESRWMLFSGPTRGM